MKNQSLECPKEVMHVFDNGGYTNDRYTIGLMYEDGDSYVIASNSEPQCPWGIWSVAENASIDIDELENEEYKDDNKHIGQEIEWEQLPNEVKMAINGNFENLTYWD